MAEQGGPQQSRKLGKFPNRFSSAGCEVNPNANIKQAAPWPSVSCLRGCKPEGCSRVPKDLVKPHKEGRRAGYRHPPGEVFSKSRQRMACSTDLQNPCFSPSNSVLALSSYNLTRTSTTMRLSLPDSSYVSKCLHYFVHAWKRVYGDNLKCPSSGAIRLVFRDSILHWPGAGQLGWAGWPWSPQRTSACVSPALGLQGQTIALGFVSSVGARA